MTVPPDDEKTGLPGFHSWRRVYLCVLVVLAVWIGLLAALTRVFS
jgi:hypothetical protein